ncbi:MAG: inner membrane CreD family protein [Alphaproteobacteria bacterium]|nr:inner membrane CreD family protein [Alphaproteobacteria bacterium]MCB9797452.1 inner membrane CreD family protein [Alphaproteobacteria bacterium]
MHPIVRLIGIVMVFIAASIGWMVLAGVTHERSNDRAWELRGEVTDLWGSEQLQSAPTLHFQWTTTEWVTELEEVEGQDKPREITKQVVRTHSKVQSPAKTAIQVDLALDMRRKGLVWYPLYDVVFDGVWVYTHEAALSGDLAVRFAFPTADGIYDDFRLEIDGVDRARELVPEGGAVSLMVPVVPGQKVTIAAGYASRGMTTWRYVPADGVANLEDFTLAMSTDFEDIDFPAQTLSPSRKERAGEGWDLSWEFSQVVTGHDIGMSMPEPIQPGELAAELAFSAPISLMFYFLVIFVLATLREIELHPVNYLFIAGAFFAFHLLFAYSADHLAVEAAFALSSVVSVLLVVSYLRLVVSARFAFVEAALAQLVYLVGFSLAHFQEGFTGLTITVLSILTLFLLMQWTGRVKWAEVLSVAAAPVETPPQAPAPVA